METHPSSDRPKQRLCVVVSDLETAKLDLIVEELKAIGLQEPLVLREVGTILGQGEVDLLPLLKQHPSVVSAFPDVRVRAVGKGGPAGAGPD